MATILHLLSANYLFHKSLGPFTSNMAWVFLGIVVFLMFAGLVTKRASKNRDLFSRKAARKFFAFSWTMGIIATLLVFFRQVGALYISAPIFLLIWLVIAIFWFMLVLRYVLVVAPGRRKALMEDEQKKKYLP